jgi:signal transduction histidine kinase
MEPRLRTIAHELSNTLTVIRGSTEFAMEKLEPDHPARQDVDNATRAADRAFQLTRELLELTAQR